MSQTVPSPSSAEIPRRKSLSASVGIGIRDRLAALFNPIAARHSREFLSACGISFALHFVLFFTLSLYFFDIPAQVAASFLSTIQPEEVPEPVVSLDALKTEDVGQNIDEDNAANMADQAAVTGIAIVEPTANIASTLPQEFQTPAARLAETEAIPQEAPLLSLLTTTGAAVTTNEGGTKGAIDRLTREIAASLRESRTCVMWLFDASRSLEGRREQIAHQFENVYQELGALDLGAEGALTTAVASYGDKFDAITPIPVDDVETIRDAIRNIEPDESGNERVFYAVQEAVRRWNKHRLEPRRNALMIIVTDEKGDDIQQLEASIQLCRKAGIRCYVLGNAALFGRLKGYVRWQYEDGETEELPVDQGPETAYPEAVQLGFWSVNGRDLERMSAAYGPYGLTRLCAETGGVYFIADESRVHRFDPEIMRNYLPDYRSLAAYERDVKKHPAKNALVEASTRTAADGIALPSLVFRADTDATLKEQLFEAQKPAAELEYKLNIMLTALEAGEKDRDKILEPRWQAGYDLALGRVLTMRVRAHGFNAVLADMKTNPKTFQNKNNNHWIIEPAEEVSSGIQLKKMGAKGVELLKKVIREHPGTPWELIARRELSRPLGWQWAETYFDIPKPPDTENGTPRPPRKPPPPRDKPKL
jgi:hypothetical protein